jgi:hypothetical protein
VGEPALSGISPNPAKNAGQAADSASGGLARHIILMPLQEIPPLPVTQTVERVGIRIIF